MAEPQEGDRLVDRYVLEARVGAGGMGVVWRATDTVLDRVVALKHVRLDRLGGEDTPAVRDRVSREARAAARLHHANAVTVFDVVQDGDDRWLVMEYLPSRSLDDLISQDGPLDPRTVARVGAAVAAALAAAHATGMVHRDVKPANVLMGTTGAVKLADFGISVVAGDTRLTQTGMVIGTLAYLAPEVANGADAVPASDVFSLGATLYAAVEGESPYATRGSEQSPFQVLRAAATADHPPPQRAGRLTGALAALMQPDPARRPSASAAASMLAEIADAAPPTATALAPPQPVSEAARPRRIRPATVAIAALVALAVLAGLLVALRGSRVVPGSASAAGAGGSCDAPSQTAVIGLIAPITGSLDVLGVGMRNSAQLAVDQANARCALPGYRFELRVVDDAGDPAVAERAARTFAADPAVVGVIGSLTSSVTEPATPVLAQAGIVHISPAATIYQLTLGDDPAKPRRPYTNFFRMVTSDLQQGPAAADYLAEKQLDRRVAVIDDGSGYGTDLTAGFTSRLRERGGEVLVTGRISPDGTDFGEIVGQVAAAGPQVVYYGGDHPAAGKLAQQLTAAGVTAPLMGGDGILTSSYVAAGGRAGDLATSIGAPPELLESARPFLTDYAVAGFPDGATLWGAPTFDAVQVVIAGVRATRSGPPGPVDRGAVTSAVQQTDLAGATGSISFDQFGDPRRRLVTIHAVQGSDFEPVQAIG